MSNNRQRLGQTGEEIARNYCKKKGYSIVANNYRNKLGEIDIIAKNGAYTVFIEVKTRTGKAYGHPAAAVTAKKQRQISKVALYYLTEQKMFGVPARFDVISIRFEDKEYQIDHITDAFELCE